MISSNSKLVYMYEEKSWMPRHLDTHFYQLWLETTECILYLDDDNYIIQTISIGAINQPIPALTAGKLTILHLEKQIKGKQLLWKQLSLLKEPV